MRTTKNARFLLAVVAVALVAGGPKPAAGQSLQNIILQNSFTPGGAGARASGMGGAFIAVADDGTASSFNPGGLSQLRRSELAVVYFGRQVNRVIEDEGQLTLDETQTTSNRDGLEFAGLAIPFEIGSRRLTVQASYQRAVDLFGRGQASITFPVEDAPAPGPLSEGLGTYTIDLDSEQSGALHTGTLGAGLDVAGPLSIGASLNFWRGAWTAWGSELQKQQGQGGGAPEPLLDLAFRQQQQLRGMSLNLGLLLHGSWLRVGGVVRLPFDGNYRLDETQTITTPAGEPQAQQYTMKSRLRWPRSVGLGFAVRPLRRLTLAADFVHSEWSQAVLENVPNGALLANPVPDENGQPLANVYTDRNYFDLFPASQTLTSDSGQWRAGLEYLLTFSKVVIPMRIGAFYEESPVPDLAMEKARTLAGFTIGWGLNFDRVVLDLSFEARYTNGATAAVLSPDLRRSEKVTASEDVLIQRVVASLILRLGKTGDEDPVVRGLRKLFGG